MNSIIICGRLCRDPEVRYTGTGENTSTVARFTVAVSRRFKKDGEADADFFNCVAFGKNGSFVEKYMHMGNKVVVRGSMKQDNYVNKDGEKVYTWQVIADEIDFGESKSSAESGNGNTAKTEKKPKEKKQEQQTFQTGPDGFMNIPDEILEDAPFN